MAMAIGAPLPASAQDAAAQGRAAAAPTPVTDVGPALPAATPMTDLLTRMDALETQVARLTAQNEELANRQHLIDVRLGPVAAATTTTEAAISSLGTPNAAGSRDAAGSPEVAPALPPVISRSANTSNLAAMTDGASVSTSADHAAGPAHPSAQRIAAVKAVIKPRTGDAGLDEYTYGFRLYTAKFYPEAAQQLKLYIAQYPGDLHVSYARNLLGRAYLDDGKPGEAAPWFLANYKTDAHGPRAADSLLNLAAAMRGLRDDTRACIALNEFAATYATEAQGRLRQDYTRTRGTLTCK